MTEDQGADSSEADEATADAEFDIDAWEEVAYDEPPEGPKLTRVTIRKTYRGPIKGTGVAEVLTAQGPAGTASRWRPSTTGGSASATRTSGSAPFEECSALGTAAARGEPSLSA